MGGPYCMQTTHMCVASRQSSALHLAVSRGLEGMVGWLLQRGIKTELKDKHNNTPLRLAEAKNNPTIISLLGGDPFARYAGGNSVPSHAGSSASPRVSPPAARSAAIASSRAVSPPPGASAPSAAPPANVW